MTLSTFDGVKWLQTCLALRHFRISHLRLTVHTFAVRGPQYRCEDGPWRDTLQEAIEAHRAKHNDGGGI